MCVCVKMCVREKGVRVLLNWRRGESCEVVGKESKARRGGGETLAEEEVMVRLSQVAADLACCLSPLLRAPKKQKRGNFLGFFFYKKYVPVTTLGIAPKKTPDNFLYFFEGFTRGFSGGNTRGSTGYQCMVFTMTQENDLSRSQNVSSL